MIQLILALLPFTAIGFWFWMFRDVTKNELHPLLWRPETFGLNYQLFISNRAKVAQRRGHDTEDESIRHQ
jgi:hypothetical protein